MKRGKAIESKKGAGDLNSTNAISPVKRPRGNPNLKKGINNPKGEFDPAGPIVAPANKLKVFVPRMAQFMEEEGWSLLENQARIPGAKNQMPAIKMAASYAYGDAPQSIDITSGGDKVTSVVDFLSMKAQPGPQAQGAEGSGGD